MYMYIAEVSIEAYWQEGQRKSVLIDDTDHPNGVPGALRASLPMKKSGKWGDCYLY